jgi:hypothetical protein
MHRLRCLLWIGFGCWIVASMAILPPIAPRAGAEEVAAPGRHALLVGCTKYPSLVMAQQLAGPANDVLLMRTLLIEHFQFSAEEITILSEDAGGDRRPIRANIEREFRRLAEQVKPGDQVVILLAGHGSQQPDDDPDNPDDPEPDGYDEIFLPADIGAWDGSKQQVENAIIDDEIRVWLADIHGQGAFVWIIIDACHSGTMIRGASEEVLRQVPPEQLVPAEALAQAARHAAERSERTRGIPGPSEMPGVTGGASGVVALYAAQSSEPTIERPLPPDGEQRQRYGLLTYTINQVLVQAQSPITYRELTQRVHSQYTRWQRTYPTPMLEGTHVDREVLGQTDWQGRSRLLLTRDDLGGYTVNAGSLHGLTKGSILEVYPLAGDADAAQALGHVVIAQVQPLRSSVSPCEFDNRPAVEDLPSEARCSLVFKDYGDYRVRVAVNCRGDDGQPVPQAQADGIADVLRRLAAKQGSFVRLCEDEAPPDWLLRVVGEQVYLVPAAGWVAKASSDISTASPPLFGPAPLGPNLASWLDERFRRIARVHNLLRVDADGPGSAPGPGADVNVEVELVRYASETATDFEVIQWDNGLTLSEGDTVQFRVKNAGRQSVDVTLLFVDSEYGITAYFPVPGRWDDNRIAPGHTFRSPRAEVTGTDLPEHMVVIAVIPPPQGQRIDFSFLAQPSLERVRGAAMSGGGLDSPLGQLLQTALFAEGTTRGLRTTMDNHAVRRITWNVVSRKE